MHIASPFPNLFCLCIALRFYYISPSYFISFPLFFAHCFLLLYPTFANIDISLYDRTHKKDFRLFCLRTEEYKHNLFVFAAGKHA